MVVSKPDSCTVPLVLYATQSEPKPIYTEIKQEVGYTHIHRQIHSVTHIHTHTHTHTHTHNTHTHTHTHTHAHTHTHTYMYTHLIVPNLQCYMQKKALKS